MKIAKSKLKQIIQEEKNWIQRVDKEIKKDGTKGVCTGKKFGGPTCRPGTPRYNLAKTFRNMNEEYAGEEYDEGHADSYNYGDTAPRKDSPEYLKGFEAGIRQKEEESGDDYYDIRKSDLGPDRLEEDEWPDKVKKGRFTSYCKREGFDGPGIGCAEKAMDSDDASVRGMASFYMNTVKPKGKDASDVAEENLNLKLTKESLSQMIGEVLEEYGYRGRPTDKISETSMASGAVQGYVSNTTKNPTRTSLAEKAPPGKKAMVKDLKKKMCGGKDDCPEAFATAWSQHNKGK